MHSLLGVNWMKDKHLFEDRAIKNTTYSITILKTNAWFVNQGTCSAGKSARIECFSLLSLDFLPLQADSEWSLSQPNRT